MAPIGSAEERPFPTIIALGAAWPVSTQEGQATPLIVLDHQSTLENGATLRLGYRTVSPSASLTVPRTSWLDTEYGGDATFLSEGNGTDLYDNGTRLEPLFFRGNRFSIFAGANFFPNAPWQGTLRVGGSQYAFSEIKEQTREGFQLPPSFADRFAEATFKRVGLFHEEGFLEVRGRRSHRLRWESWEFESDAEATRSPWLQFVTFEDRVEFENQEVKGTLLRASGTGLDFFSGFRVGGLTSDLAVAGYYRNEFRAREVTMLKLRHEVAFAEDRILYLFADMARFEELPLAFRTDPERQKTLAGLAVGFRYGIRGLKGLPIIVTYGEGLNVPESSDEPHRRELVLVAAAGF